MTTLWPSTVSLIAEGPEGKNSLRFRVDFNAALRYTMCSKCSRLPKARSYANCASLDWQ
jgi:hypothetical protein